MNDNLFERFFKIEYLWLATGIKTSQTNEQSRGTGLIYDIVNHLISSSFPDLSLFSHFGFNHNSSTI